MGIGFFPIGDSTTGLLALRPATAARQMNNAMPNQAMPLRFRLGSAEGRRTNARSKIDRTNQYREPARSHEYARINSLCPRRSRRSCCGEFVGDSKASFKKPYASCNSKN